MHSLALYVGGNDMQGRMIRRSLMRYLNLSLILVLRSISSAVKRRFPTMDHMVEAGFMTPLELEMFQAVPNLEFNTYWIPSTWFIALLKDTKKSNRITDSQGLQTIVQEFNEFRSKCGLLWSYDWISIPLVYTQVVTLATYSFFLAALVGRQYVDETTSKHKKQFQMEVDVYIPLFTILQFFFYMGLLKVAEQLINPFGDDDEDFELNWLIDRHIKVSYLGVDTLMSRYPPLVKDKYFDDFNITLPYTGAAFAYKKKTYRGSVHNMLVPEDQQSMFLPEISEEEDDDHDSYSYSCKRNSSKTSSFVNLMNAVSPPAGIWRSNAEKVGQTPCGTVEADFQQNESKTNVILEKFNTKAPWKSQSNPLQIPLSSHVINPLENWSSQSTLDSVDSIQANADSPDIKLTNVFESSFQRMHENVNLSTDVMSVEKTKNTGETQSQCGSVSSNSPVKKEDSKIPKSSSTGSIAQSLRLSFNKHLKGFTENSSVKKDNILGRRQSSSSGQWKGVRWKPVIDDSTGDAWSDNSDRRFSYDACKQCKRPSIASESPPLAPPSHLSSSESVTASFQSINSGNQPFDLFPVPVFVKNEAEKPLKTKSWAGVSGSECPVNELCQKEIVTTSSLPNICLSVAHLNSSAGQSSNSFTMPVEDQSLSLNLLKKSFSTSPRMFSKLQDTIEEENETK